MLKIEAGNKQSKANKQTNKQKTTGGKSNDKNRMRSL